MVATVSLGLLALRAHCSGQGTLFLVMPFHMSQTVSYLDSSQVGLELCPYGAQATLEGTWLLVHIQERL